MDIVCRWHWRISWCYPDHVLITCDHQTTIWGYFKEISLLSTSRSHLQEKYLLNPNSLDLVMKKISLTIESWALLWHFLMHFLSKKNDQPLVSNNNSIFCMESLRITELWFISLMMMMNIIDKVLYLIFILGEVMPNTL